MVAATGKARALGPRAIGFADPGALSMYLILDFMAQYVTSASAGVSDLIPCRDPAFCTSARNLVRDGTSEAVSGIGSSVFLNP